MTTLGVTPVSAQPTTLVGKCGRWCAEAMPVESEHERVRTFLYGAPIIRTMDRYAALLDSRDQHESEEQP